MNTCIAILQNNSMPQLICHDEVMTCKCGAVLHEVPTTTRPRSRFAFEITHKRDGTPIKDLATKGAHLGVVELGWCEVCEDYCAVIDSEDDPKVWSELPKLHQPQ